MVDVVRSDKVSQVDFCESFGHSDDRLHVPDTNLETASHLGFSPQLGVELREFVLVDLLELGLDVSSGVDQVLLQHIVRYQVFVFSVHPVVGEELLLAELVGLFLLFELSIGVIFAQEGTHN